MIPFGKTQGGREVHAIDITSGTLSARILTFGAILNDVRLAGVEYALTLGSPDLAAYEGPMASFGSYMGPVVNRIRGAQADIDGRSYEFEVNFERRHTLHSGSEGSHRHIWTVDDQGADYVRLSLVLPHGMGGFPGNRHVALAYRIEGDALVMTVHATTDAPTLLSFANHSYWTLDGEPGYAGHTLTCPANMYLEADDALMPTGKILPVTGTAYDARDGLTLAGNEDQFFDMNYCFSDCDQPLRNMAVLRGTTGVTLHMDSTAPGLQVYDCATIRAEGFETHHPTPYGPYAGLALEAQRWPGALEHKHFPSIAYGPDKGFEQTVRWRFSNSPAQDA